MEADEESPPPFTALILITEIFSFFKQHVLVYIHKNMQLSL
jgi:hypothetical protein